MVLLILLFTFEAKIKCNLLVKAAPPSVDSETISLPEEIGFSLPSLPNAITMSLLKIARFYSRLTRFC